MLIPTIFSKEKATAETVVSVMSWNLTNQCEISPQSEHSTNTLFLCRFCDFVQHSELVQILQWYWNDRKQDWNNIITWLWMRSYGTGNDRLSYPIIAKSRSLVQPITIARVNFANNCVKSRVSSFFYSGAWRKFGYVVGKCIERKQEFLSDKFLKLSTTRKYSSRMHISHNCYH